MVTRREWYTRVNATWPDGPMPPLTFDEAVRAYKKLFRFVKGHASRFKTKDFKRTSGNRYNNTGRGIINPDLGWKTFIHHLSHQFEPSGHNGAHARMEMRLIKEVIRRGWLSGSLKSPEKPEPVAPTKTQIVSAKLDHAQRMLMRAATRAKRATTILKKWERKVRYYERQAVR